MRRLLDLELGWLRGYPDGRRSGSGAEAEVGWVERSRPGCSGVARMVSRSDLQKAKRHIQALTRDFPRALPAVVGDPAEWRAGVEWLLGRLGQWLRGDAEVARWWRFDEVFEDRPMSARDRRTVREVVASRPALADLAATLLCGGHEAEDRRTDLCALVVARADAAGPLEMERAADVLKCTRCGSRRRWIAAIKQRETRVRILEHLGLESVAPPPAPPRAPPQLELSWEGA